MPLEYIYPAHRPLRTLLALEMQRGAVGAHCTHLPLRTLLTSNHAARRRWGAGHHDANLPLRTLLAFEMEHVSGVSGKHVLHAHHPIRTLLTLEVLHEAVGEPARTTRSAPRSPS